MPWEFLGLEREEADARAVKKAYARLLKQTRPDKDPEGFRKLREAYEAALFQLEGVDLSQLVIPTDGPQTPATADSPVHEKDRPQDLSGPKPPPSRWEPVDDHPEVDPLDQVQNAWRNRDGIELRKALLKLIRLAIQEPSHADSVNEALASTPHHILDIVLRQITPEEMLVELEHENSTVSQGWASYWLQRAQADRLAAFGEAWLKNQGQLVQSKAAIHLALYLAMSLSLYRNKLAHRLADVAFPLVDAKKATPFDFLDSLLLIGQHMQSAPEDDKTFWTQYFVLNLDFNWRSKKPQTHLWRISSMPESETLIRLIAPRVPREAFGEDPEEEAVVVEVLKKKRHRRRKVKRNTYGGGRSNEEETDEDELEVIVDKPKWGIPIKGIVIGTAVVVALILLSLLLGKFL